jgi:methionine sulfoxide reductase catalytic subunit
LWLLPIGLLVLLVAVAVARGIRDTGSVRHFISRYPRTVTTGNVNQASGFPAWLAAQHFVNLFFMMFIIRSGWQILADDPRLYWTRHSTPGRDWFRFQKPVPDDQLWTARKDSVSLPGHTAAPGARIDPSGCEQRSRTTGVAD